MVAYNKIDVPDSGDYADEVREYLMSEGIASEDIFPVSAATGKGVTALVRRVRAVLDALPVEARTAFLAMPAPSCCTWISESAKQRLSLKAQKSLRNGQALAGSCLGACTIDALHERE